MLRGIYILVILLKKNITVKVGKLGKLKFDKGRYFYVGSAQNNLEKRIKRHLSRKKKGYWHIDYFLKHGKIIGIFYNESDIKEECKFAKKFEEKLIPILNFGCSDCNCRSHLFYGSKNEIICITDSLDMISYF